MDKIKYDRHNVITNKDEFKNNKNVYSKYEYFKHIGKVKKISK